MQEMVSILEWGVIRTCGVERLEVADAGSGDARRW